VADANGQALLNVTTAGSLVHAPYPTGSAPQCLAAGSAGRVTVGLPVNSPQQIGQLAPGGSVQTIDRPNGSDPFGVAFGADGAFWVAEFAGNRLARVTTDGRLTTLTGFPTNVSGRGPRQITAGPDHTLWTTLDSPGDATLSQIAKVSGVEPSGGGGTPPPDTTAPRVSAARLSRAKVRARTGAVTLRFTSNEAGSATVVLSRRLPGRRKGTACLKPTHRLRKAKRCTRQNRVKTIRAAVAAGANAVHIRVRALPAGSYSVALTVADVKGNRAARVTRGLTIRKRRLPAK
jgi:streptogramin lyase